MIGRKETEALLAAQVKVAVAVIVEAKGSSPRDSGTIMAVYAGGVLGTVGGGTVEHQVIEAAQVMLAEDGDPCVLEFPLGPDLDQCCGGRMQIALGLANPTGDQIWRDGPKFPDPESKRSVIVYGAGHVGQAILRALAPLPFQVMLVDARPNPLRGISEVVTTPLPEAVAEEASGDTFHVVLTHSHAVDLEVVSTVLSRKFGFCGLIGSKTKRTLFERRLRERGHTPEIIEQMRCPIGLPLLKDKRPEVIAASVAVQLLLRDQMLRGNE